MGYWGTSSTGGSLRPSGDRNPDGSEMLWGDPPPPTGSTRASPT